MASIAALSTINSPSGRGTGALALLLQDPFFAFLEQINGGAWQLGATTNKFRPNNIGIGSIQGRDIGGTDAPYNAEQYNIPDEISNALSAVGGFIKIDKSYLADFNRGLDTFHLDTDMKTAFKNWIKAFKIALFNGSGAGTPKQIKGLATILSGSDIPGYSTKRVIDATTPSSVENTAATGTGAAKSLDITTSTNDNLIYEAILQLLALTDNPQALILNQSLWAKLSVILFRKSSKMDTMVTDFGVKFDTFNGTPLVVVPNEVITNSEPDNTSTTPLTNTTSIYAVDFGEDLTSIITNSGLEYNDYNAVPNEVKSQDNWEIRCGWRITEPKSITRMRNIKIS